MEWQGLAADTHIVGGWGAVPVSRVRTNCGRTGSCRDPGCWSALLWLQSLSMGTCMAVKASDESQDKGVQVHSLGASCR